MSEKSRVVADKSDFSESQIEVSIIIDSAINSNTLSYTILSRTLDIEHRREIGL